MIGRTLALLRTARNAPVHPVTALLGALCVVAGAGVVQRYVAQQQAGLAVAWHQLQAAAGDAELLAERVGWAEMQRRFDAQAETIAEYQRALHDRHRTEDLDPLGRGDQADEPELVDELAGGDQ